jgi:protein-disulfide isomerase-like protein with CxxC motif
MNIELLAFTDSVCTWCWGSEPVLRRLETGYGDSFRIHYVMGGRETGTSWSPAEVAFRATRELESAASSLVGPS